MNLILCEPHELGADGAVSLTGARAAHVRTVLRAEPGDTVRLGLVDGPKGRGEILTMADDVVVLRCELGTEPPPAPPVDLLLALPRPKVLRRLWAQLAALGVGRIMLTNAARVERNYFDAHVLEEATFRPLLLEGLQQAGDTRLPRVSIHRQFRILVEDELGPLPDDELRLLAHPGNGASVQATVSASRHGRALLAVGPEGGWNTFELDLLARHGFASVGLGPRTLRTDTACVALVAVLHEALRHRSPA